eukprot:TRINITY_DN210605_c0_g1_i2.p1 TRINITY_DN210605_c0_g1~~TRINITY_DN210605_c0_g1_i2.p1  ORF type:complete len:333 (-),score=43.99 TRINITY_DN210605_c0_g1_i2:78-1076(-)
MRIAIIKLSAMGDIIHAMLALQFIKKEKPNIKIDWFVEESFSSVLKDNPDIDNIFTLNLKSIKKSKKNIFKEIKNLKKYKNNYDLIIDAQGLIKSAIVSKLIGKNVAGFNKKSTREGFASSFYKKRIESNYSKNVIERNLDVLLKPLNVKFSKEDILEKKPFLYFDTEKENFSKYLKENQKNILLVVGASWPSKMYSKEKFAKIADNLDGNILIAWGSEKEKEIGEYISMNSKAILLPQLSLNDLKALVSQVDLLIGNDTGPTHMAWALNIPSITIFGCTPGKRNTYETDINKIIESHSIVNPLKLKKDDFSINDVDENKIVTMAKGLLNDE